MPSKAVNNANSGHSKVLIYIICGTDSAADGFNNDAFVYLSFSFRY